MSQNVINHFVQQYTTNVQMLLQQKGSKLRDTVTMGKHTGKAAVLVDQFGSTTAHKRTTRYAPLTPANMPTDRRWVYPVDYDWNDLIDNADKLRMLIDPQSSYVTAGTYAMGRAMDDEIISGFFADAKTGEAGGTTTSFLAANQVAVNFGAGAACGLTVAKLKEARRLLLANEVDFDAETVYVAVTAKQDYDLLQEAQIINMDYNTRPVLVDGRIKSFLGFQFIDIQRLSLDGSSYRRIPVWVKSGMHLGMWEDIKTDVSQRKDLEGLPWQVYCYGTFGATRVEEKRVVEIKCSEA